LYYEAVGATSKSKRRLDKGNSFIPLR